MQKILFFDSDKTLKTFSKTCQLKEVYPIYFKESFNEISLKKIKPYLDAKIISVFTHSEKLSLQKLDLFKNDDYQLFISYSNPRECDKFIVKTFLVLLMSKNFLLVL